ncbi:M23 family metallopeptidase [Fusibacter bizertensis]
MKKSRLILIIALILIVCLGAFYVYKINVFDINTLKAVDITLSGETEPSVYELDLKSKNALFSSLSSLSEMDAPDETFLKNAVIYDVTLLNHWDLTHKFKIYFLADHEVYAKIDNDKTLYKVIDPSFFYGADGFDALYSLQNFPEMRLLLDDTAVSYTSNQIKWSYKRLNGQWYSLDQPAIAFDSEIAKVTSTSEVLGLTLDKTPNNAMLKIIDKDSKTLVFEGIANVRQLPYPEYDGNFKYELSLTWSDETNGYKGDTSLSFEVDVNLPETYSLSKETLTQGEMLVVTAQHVNNIADIHLDQDLVTAFTWFKSGMNYRGYLPTNYYTNPGTYTLTFNNSTTGTSTPLDVEVVSRDFKVQNLTIDPTVEASTRNDDAYAEYREVFNPARDISAEERYYTEPFILPTTGKLNTEFGESRNVNGAPTTYRHIGIDIGAPRGATVVAVNNGQIVLAQKLILTGNTIIIDHGEGLFSVYEHLDSLAVEKGVLVERGQTIATVGSTGFSTGPHLHFTMSYYRTDIEPGYILYGEPLTKENYKELMK